MGFIYQADVWCHECGVAIRKRLTAEGKAPEDPSDEYSYDSDNFPKDANTGSEADCPFHCAAGAECFNAIELSDGTKVGMLLTEELTSDGAEYVVQAVREGGTVAVEVWKPAFDWLDFDDDEDEEDNEDSDEVGGDD